MQTVGIVDVPIAEQFLANLLALEVKLQRLLELSPLAIGLSNVLKTAAIFAMGLSQDFRYYFKCLLVQ